MPPRHKSVELESRAMGDGDGIRDLTQPTGDISASINYL
jgi:hypothetical protein